MTDASEIKDEKITFNGMEIILSRYLPENFLAIRDRSGLYVLDLRVPGKPYWISLPGIEVGMSILNTDNPWFKSIKNKPTERNL